MDLRARALPWGKGLLTATGALAILAVVVLWTARYITWSGNVDTFYSMNLDDGPYVFWTDDSTIRIISLTYEPSEDDVSSIGNVLRAAWSQELEADFRIAEADVDLRNKAAAQAAIQDAGIVFDPYAPHSIDGSVFEADTVVAFSDIHGAYNHLEILLRTHRITDDALNWNFGTGHMVIAGDIVDKGPGVTECLWLIRKLESQAEEAGGKVHYLLGNHEIMVLRGGLEPQHRGYKYRTIAKELGIGYGDLYGKNSEMGRWLRTKNTTIRINDRLYVHAGLSDVLVDQGLSLDAINDYGRKLVGLDHFYEVSAEDRAYLELIDSYWGPYDYRGYTGIRGEVGKIATVFSDKVDDLARHENVDRIMNKIFSYYDCTQAVVGHSHMKDVSMLRDGRVIGIDIRVPKDDMITDESNAQFLLVEGGNLFRLTLDGKKESLHE